VSKEAVRALLRLLLPPIEGSPSWSWEHAAGGDAGAAAARAEALSSSVSAAADWRLRAAGDPAAVAAAAAAARSTQLAHVNASAAFAHLAADPRGRQYIALGLEDQYVHAGGSLAAMAVGGGRRRSGDPQRGAARMDGRRGLGRQQRGRQGAERAAGGWGGGVRTPGAGACLPACLLACLPACLLACLPACLLACLPACLLACLPALKCAV
jgi:hypothetical protein